MTFAKSILLDNEDAFHPQVEKIFKQIFTDFDKDGDGSLKVSELRNFSKAASGNQKPFSNEEIEEIFEYFDSDDRKLTFRGFLEMYQIQTLADEEETLTDLRNLKFADEIDLLGREAERKAALPNSSAQKSEA